MMSEEPMALLCHGMPSEQQQVLYSGPTTNVRLGLAAARYAARVETWQLGFWLALRDINMPSATMKTTLRAAAANCGAAAFSVNNDTKTV